MGTVWAREGHTIDGHIFRTPARVHVEQAAEGLSGEEARELAAHLLDAADELDRLAAP